MEKLNRLQALTGDKDVCGEESAFQHSTYVKPQNVYEGTDSEDDEYIISESRHPPRLVVKDFGPSDNPSGFDTNPPDFPEYRLEIGQVAAEGETFCPFEAIKRYPYAFIGNANRQRVTHNFFDQGRLFNQLWDFFYLFHASTDTQQQPILFVPTKQFKYLLETINRKLRTNLTIPLGGCQGKFAFTFENDGTPQPRYLGRARDRNMADNLKNNIPPRYYRPGSELLGQAAPTDRSLAAFQEKINQILQAQKGKKAINKEKQKKQRIEQQHSWNHGTKRIQRYLGLRAREARTAQMEVIRTSLRDSGLSGLSWDFEQAVKAAAAQLPPCTAFHPGRLAQFEQEESVVFVCVDVEAYERNTKLITEIGIATLDTKDITSVLPGEGGANWMSAIRARHFRINEHRHLNNVEFVTGCADRFEFGASEFINLKNAPQIVASCFKHPFSNPDEVELDYAEGPKRNIVLVGHDLGADIAFLQTLGYDVHNLSNLLETADTAYMWRYLKRENNPRSLGSILAELEITGWNLHNAGNDAVYTLQAMIGIAIKQIEEKKKAKEIIEKEKKVRISEALKEATEHAMEREEGWSSDGSDGGAPSTPVPSSANGKKGNGQNKAGRSQYSEGPWRPATQQSTGQMGERQGWQERAQPGPQSMRNTSLSENKPASWGGSWGDSGRNNQNKGQPSW